MTLRRLWIVSINLRNVIYSRNFSLVEKRAIKLGLAKIPEGNQNEIVESLLTSLAITQSKNQQFDCKSPNALPLIEIQFQSVKLWPIIVIEQNGILFCGLTLIDDQSLQPIHCPSISLTLTALQVVADYYSNEKSILNMESFISSTMPFGTLINKNFYEKPMVSVNRQTEQIVVQIIVKELISSAINSDELIYGTIKIINSEQIPIEGIIEMQIQHLKLCNMVLSPECIMKDDKIEVKMSKKVQNSIISYKFSQELIKGNFFNYEYLIIKDDITPNIYKFQLLIMLKDHSQIKFNYFNVHIKQFQNGQVINPQKVVLSCGQIKIDNRGLIWNVGQKFPKSGQIKFNFECELDEIKLKQLETKLNFKIDDFDQSILKLRNDNIKFRTNLKYSKRIFINLDVSLSSFGYKLVHKLSQ